MYLTTSSALNHPWTAAHEYGHALHDAALGGLWTATNCSPHFVTLPSSYSCALQEGFADFAGSIGGAAVNHVPYNFESLHVEVADSVGMIEGNVAAMFVDLVDSTNETFDQTTFPGDYVATVFKTCATKTTGVGAWIPRWNVTQLVWCYETAENPSLQSTEFSHMVTWTDETESASEPGTWSQTDVRNTWMLNVGVSDPPGGGGGDGGGGGGGGGGSPPQVHPRTWKPTFSKTSALLR